MDDDHFRTLLPHLRRGDHAAFWECVRCWEAHLRNAARRSLPRGCTAECAEDVLQDAWLCMHQSVVTFREHSAGQFVRWCETIVRRRAADHVIKQSCRTIRHHQTIGLLESSVGTGAPTPTDTVAAAELADRVQEAVARLPTDWAAALRSRDDGKPFRDIAREQGCTEETARWRVFKARQQLAIELRADMSSFVPDDAA